MDGSETGWTAWGIRLLIMLPAQAVFGIAALRRPGFLRWNFAPILAAVTPPAMFGLVSERAFPILVAAMCVGLIPVGFRMQAEASRSPAGAPA